MFPGKMQYTPIEKLSGGEKRRLMLMMVLIKNPNFLILDEPTNDLDLLTLNKLEDFLQNFGGCLIIVSHDRFFMDKLVDHYFVFEGQGVIRDFHGTYDEYRDEILNRISDEDKKKPTAQTSSKTKEKTQESESDQKLSYNERREFNKREKEIAKLGVQKTKLEKKMANSDLDYGELNELSKEFEELKEKIEEKELVWLEMAERA
jgi:ATP-binding cassette subfamily F protein uup